MNFHRLQASSTTSSNNEVFSSSSSSHKKHKKEKKSKKDKKEKRDKYQNGEMSSSKKHKHKHRDRDKESNSGLKLKIKPIAPGANPEIVQPLKICIGGSSSAASNASNSKKRHRQQSDSSNSSMDSIADPARKMSRVMGTSTEQESSFLSGRANFNYKKKVITWARKNFSPESIPLEKIQRSIVRFFWFLIGFSVSSVMELSSIGEILERTRTTFKRKDERILLFLKPSFALLIYVF